MVTIDIGHIPEDFLICPDCEKPLQDIGGVLGCLCLWGGRWPTAAMIEEFMLDEKDTVLIREVKLP